MAYNVSYIKQLRCLTHTFGNILMSSPLTSYIFFLIFLYLVFWEEMQVRGNIQGSFSNLCIVGKNDKKVKGSLTFCLINSTKREQNTKQAFRGVPGPGLSPDAVASAGPTARLCFSHL